MSNVVNIKDVNLKKALNDILGPGDITDTKMLTLTTFTANDKNIKDLTGLEYATNITELVLTNNEISSIYPLASLTALTYLNLNSNSITDISPIGFVEITKPNGIIIYSQEIYIERVINLGESFVLKLDFLKDHKRLPIGSIIPNQNGVFDIRNNLITWNNINQDTTVSFNFSKMPSSDVAVFFEGDVYINVQVNLILDPILRKLISRILTGTDDAVITADLIKGLTYLDASNQGNIDLTGLRYATNLTNLILSNNQISNINEISNLTKLNSLSLDSNSIVDTTFLENLRNLTYLKLSNNRIADTQSLRNLTNLQSLYLDINNIVNIDYLENLKKLTYLNLNNNNITDIQPLINLTKLSSLYLDNNTIGNVSYLANLKDLAHLNLNNNNIADIESLKGLTKLQSLYMDKNLIENISYLESLIELKSLSLKYNGISNIYPLISLTKLDTLILSNNKIYDIRIISKLDRLTNFEGLNQGISIEDRLDLGKAYTLALSFLRDINNLTPNIDKISHSGRLSVNGKYIVWDNANSTMNLQFSFNEVDQFSGTVVINLQQNSPIYMEENLKQAINEQLGRTKDSSVDITIKDIENIKELNLNGKGISSISGLQYAKNLNKLSLVDNKIEDISPLENLVNLTSLNLSINNIEDISYLENLTNLVLLYLYDNNINDISSLANLKNLKYLNIGMNYINDFSKINSIIPDLIIYYKKNKN